MIRKGDKVEISSMYGDCEGTATHDCSDPYMSKIRLICADTGKRLAVRGDLADSIEVNGIPLDEFSEAYSREIITNEIRLGNI